VEERIVGFDAQSLSRDSDRYAAWESDEGLSNFFFFLLFFLSVFFENTFVSFSLVL
jgi:hypothetical protein